MVKWQEFRVHEDKLKELVACEQGCAIGAARGKKQCNSMRKEKRIVEKDRRIAQLETQCSPEINSNTRITELEAQSVAGVAKIEELERKLSVNNITVTNARIKQLESQSVTLRQQLSERDDANLKELGERLAEKDDRITGQEAQCSTDATKIQQLEASHIAVGKQATNRNSKSASYNN